MAVPFGPMATPNETPGEEVRRVRKARGLSQAALSRLASVSARTIGRIETGRDYDDPRSLPAVQQALGLGEYANKNEPTLSKATALDLANEFVRRLSVAESIIRDARTRPGQVPTDDPNIIFPDQADTGEPNAPAESDR